MASYEDTAKRWTEIVLGLTDKQPLRAERMPVMYPVDRYGRNGSDPRHLAIFSYGSHFELARLVRPRHGAPFFLVNGDTYSVTTARHQREVRSAIAKTGVPSVIVPHSAAAAAGIVLDSVRVLAAEDEWTEKTTHTVTLPDGMADDMLTELRAKAHAELERVTNDAGREYGYSHGARSAEVRRTVGSASIMCRIFVAGYDYGVNGWTIHAPEDWRVSWYRNGGALERHEDGRFTYDTWRHWLGASVFTATVCEYRERVIARVSAREDDGTHFVAGVSKRTVSATLPDDPRTVGAVNVYSERVNRKRTAAFISDFDYETAARQPLYFLAELPAKTRPESVAAALEALAPDRVREAKAAGLTVLRQGDIFAVPVPDIAAKYPVPFKHAERMAVIPLDGTGSHTVTELVTFADGRMFGRGVIRHTGREHRNVKLGNVWHELLRNTVPLQRENVQPAARVNGRVRRALAGMPRAWTILGSVD